MSMRSAVVPFHAAAAQLLALVLALPLAAASQPAEPSQLGSGRGAATAGGPAATVPMPSGAAGSGQDGAQPACAVRWQAYRRSQACFAQFQTVGGGLRGGAVQACGEPLPDPSAECGLPTLPR